MKIKKNIFLTTALLYILYTIFPLFADVFTIPVWLPSLASFVVMCLLYPKALNNKIVYWFLVYAFVLAINTVVGRSLTIGIGSVASSWKLLIEFAYLLPSISIFSILYYLKDYELTKKLLYISLGMLIASFIVAVPLLQHYSSLRDALYEEREEPAGIPGLPGYSLMHAYVLLLPVMCYGVRRLKGRSKFLVFALLIVLCFVIYDTFVTTSLLLMIMVLLFTLFYSEKNVVRLSIVFTFLWILYEFGFFVALIDIILPAFQDTPVEMKLNDFKDSLLQGSITGGSITGRIDYHAASRHAFWSNPIFGSPAVGGHSSLLDRFGGLGLVCGIPFVMIIIAYIRYFLKDIRSKTAKTFFWVGIIIAFVFLYNKGNWGAESWLMFMVLLPAGLLVFEKQTQKVLPNNNRIKT